MPQLVFRPDWTFMAFMTRALSIQVKPTLLTEVTGSSSRYKRHPNLVNREIGPLLYFQHGPEDRVTT